MPQELTVSTPSARPTDSLSRQDNIARGVIDAGEHYVDIAEYLQNQGALKRTRHTARGALGLKLAIRMRKIALAQAAFASSSVTSTISMPSREIPRSSASSLSLLPVADQHAFGKMLGGDLCDRLHHGLVFALGKSNAHRLGGQPARAGSASGPWQLLHLFGSALDKLADGLHDHDLANGDLGIELVLDHGGQGDHLHRALAQGLKRRLGGHIAIVVVSGTWQNRRSAE